MAPTTTSTTTVLGLLVADLALGAVDNYDHAAIATLGSLVAAALELVILRARLAEISAAFRYLTTPTSALVDEVLLSPLALPARHRNGLVFSLTGARAARAPEAAQPGLSRREIEVAEFLVEGLSNRDIAAPCATQRLQSHRGRQPLPAAGGHRG
jgi:ATP/maltotriose-dependent transcriptional regulator MalT